MVRVFVVVGQMYQTWRRPRAHHLHPSPSRTLLGNEQTAVYLGMPVKDTKSPRILTSLSCGGHIDRRCLGVSPGSNKKLNKGRHRARNCVSHRIHLTANNIG